MAKYMRRRGFHTIKPRDLPCDVKVAVRKAKGRPATGWSHDPQMPMIEERWRDGTKTYAQLIVLMDALEFLNIQFNMVRHDFELGELPYNAAKAMWKLSIDKDHLQNMIEALDGVKAIPVPVLMYDSDWNLKKFQEGRHRGQAAFDRREPIPVIIAKHRFY